MFNHAALVRTHYPDVASEFAKDRGYSYRALGESNLSFFLGFNGKLQEREVTFLNPFWGSISNQLELLPASQKDIIVTLSPEAKRLGARVDIQFNGPSPRIRSAFSIKPV